MSKPYSITSQEVEKIKELRKKIKDKNVDKRLYSLQLRGEGMINSKIAEKLDTSQKVVSRWVSNYKKYGIEKILGKKRGGYHRNLSFKQEENILNQFLEMAENGEIKNVKEIEKAYETAVGHSIGSGQIYYVLKRHGWRKITKKIDNKFVKAWFPTNEK